MKFYKVENIFDLHLFDNEKTAVSNFLKFLRKCILFLYFLNERNIKTSPLMMHSRWAVLHYANLKSSCRNNPLNMLYKPLNMLFALLRFLIYVCFSEAFVKSLMGKLSFFNTNFQNSFQDIVYYRILA